MAAPQVIHESQSTEFYPTDALFVEMVFSGARFLEAAMTTPTPKGPRLRKWYLVKQNVPVTFPRGLCSVGICTMRLLMQTLASPQRLGCTGTAACVLGWNSQSLAGFACLVALVQLVYQMNIKGAGEPHVLLG